MRRFFSSLAAVCAVFGVAATPSIAATSHCSASSFAMQCVRPSSTPTAHMALTGARPAVALSAQTSVLKYGIDFAWTKYSAQTARNMGARFGASYLSNDPTKNWTRSLLNDYHAHGMGTVAVYETTATRALSGYYGGRADAQYALNEERALGIPTSKPVYFAVDFDETPAQAATVKAYFQGVNSILGVSRTGGYGGYWTVSRLFNAHVIAYGWQTSAWSGGNWDSRAQLRQYAYAANFDWDMAASSDFGQTL